MRIANAGVFGHHRDVAQERMGRRKADGVAIDGGDDRLVELKLGGGAAAGDHGVVPLPFFENVATRPLGHGLDVAADAKELAGAGQHDDVDGVIVGQIVPDRPKLANQLLIDRVTCLRTVQGYGRDLVRNFHLQAFILGILGHDFLRSFSCSHTIYLVAGRLLTASCRAASRPVRPEATWRQDPAPASAAPLQDGCASIASRTTRLARAAPPEIGDVSRPVAPWQRRSTPPWHRRTAYGSR